MIDDRIEADVISALIAPDGWRNTLDGKKTLAWSIYPVIVGAAACVLECKKLIGGWTEGMPTQWQDETLQADFIRAVTLGPSVVWDNSANFRLWSIGHFLESAQHPIAAALDKCINAWLALKAGLETKKADDPWFLTWIGGRLTVLNGLLKQETKQRHKLLAELAAIYESSNGEALAPHHHWTAAAWANRMTHLIIGLPGRPTTLPEPIYSELLAEGETTDERLQDIYLMLGGNALATKKWKWTEAQVQEMPSSAHCAAFVFSRHNIFKHVILADPKRLGLAQYMVECAITLHAVVFVANLWKALVYEEQLSYAENTIKRPIQEPQS